MLFYAFFALFAFGFKILQKQQGCPQAGDDLLLVGGGNDVSEGIVSLQNVLGVAAKMFSIAGPVIVYGLSAGVVYGLIYWIFTR